MSRLSGKIKSFPSELDSIFNYIAAEPNRAHVNVNDVRHEQDARAPTVNSQGANLEAKTEVSVVKL